MVHKIPGNHIGHGLTPIMTDLKWGIGDAHKPQKKKEDYPEPDIRKNAF